MDQIKSKNNYTENARGTSLTARLILPTLLVIAITLTAVSLFGSRLSESLYNHQTLETLKNNLQLTQKALNEGWENTRGTAMRSEELLQDYTAQVFAGRLDFIGFQEKSGVIIADSYSGKIVKTYSKHNTSLDKADISRIIKHNNVTYLVTELTLGGFAMSSYFAPLGLHLIAFNKVGFNQTESRAYQRILLISIFLITAALLISMMLIVVHISITRPLRTMKLNMDNAIMRNDYDSHLDVNKGSRDLQELSLRFNTLISHINARDKQIHQHAQDLETLVEERTNELKMAQEQLVLSERLAAIGEFASSVAHELRNPLSSIKMGVEKIAGIKSIEGNNKRRLTLIQSEVDRLSDMLKGILAFAAPSPTEIKPIQLASFMKDITPLLLDIAKEENSFLKIESIKPAIKIKGDVDKLKQTFINVIKNASEASPQKGEIKLSCEEDDAKVEIIIINKGQPIPKEVEGRLFEPFFTTKSSGTGLGLATTKRIMNEMGGDITIQNASKDSIQTTIILQKA
ncbi:MAG: signal transduction histidine kinase [Alphaproteobacteria bacterium]|jgi:signal transduction histidine kinase